QRVLLETMSGLRRELRDSLPFAMEPVVYDFAINPHGTVADLTPGDEALLPPGYYALLAPQWLRSDPRQLPAARRDELDRFGAACRIDPAMAGMVETLFDRLLPRRDGGAHASESLEGLLAAHGFDREQHERIRSDLRRGLIGLAQNRLPASAAVEDVQPGDVTDARRPPDPEHAE